MTDAPSRKAFIVWLVMVFLAAIVLLVPACQPPERDESRGEFSRNVDRTIDAAGVRTLSLRTGAGTLKVVGEPGRTAIAIEGVLFVEAENLAEAKRIAGEIELTAQLERTENPVIVVTEPRVVNPGQVHTLDLTVRVPTSVLVAICRSHKPRPSAPRCAYAT